jgi:threonine dehydrogenase-like Zn-dependent dehydrogenase
MRTLRMEGNGRIAVAEAAEPEAGPGEVVIRTEASAICGSELHVYRGEGQRDGNGGHEAVGRVAAVGPDVSVVRVGQRVGVSAVYGCGKCAPCARGQYTWCRSWSFRGSMHAERFVTGALACHVLPEDVPTEAGVLLSGDGLGVPYHSNTRIPGDARTVAVFGCGPIGLGSVLLQTHLGRRVLAVDIVSYRVELARRLGAAEAIDASGCDPVARIRELVADGVDVAIEAAGRPETLKQCFAAVRPGGMVVMNGEQGPVPLSPSDDFIRRDVAAVGSWYYHFGEFGSMLALYRRGLRVTDLITHRFPFEEGAAAFELFAARRSGKVLLNYPAR